MKYFTIKELCYSENAIAKGISNEASGVAVAHLTELVDTCLDPIRERYGNPIKVSSGYRSPALNAATKGSSNTSAHTLGYAADLKPVSGGMYPLQACILEWAKTAKFDQIIIEYPVNRLAKWIHIGVKNSKGEQRRQILCTSDGKKYYPFPL